MRLYKCGSPAILPDGSPDFGPRLVGEIGVWDLPFVSYVRDYNELPLYRHDKQRSYWSRQLSFKNCECLARTWSKFQEHLPFLPVTTLSIPKPRDFHFFNTIQYRPERRDTYRMHMRAGPLLDCKAPLPVPADQYHRYR